LTLVYVIPEDLHDLAVAEARQLQLKHSSAAPAQSGQGAQRLKRLDREHAALRAGAEQELRDELMTLLVAGHETTASTLAWIFERLPHHPEVLERLEDELGAGEDDAYLTATIQETLRRAKNANRETGSSA
jgi:cytochrome P450